MAARGQARQAYRSQELGDVAEAVDRMTLGVGAAEAQEALAAPGLGRILVAVDGTPGSRHALAWAADLAKRLGSRVQVVSVAPSPQVARALQRHAPGWAAAGVAFDECRELAKRDLRHAADYLRQRGVEAETALQSGRPAHAIVAFAEANGSDLVILGSHGHGLAERVNLGSVGSAVKHHVPCSVLIARGPPDVKRVLLATDGSQRSRLAVRVGLDLAQAFGAKATLAHVVDVGSYGLARTRAVRQGKALAVQERMRESPGHRGLDTHVAFGPPARRLRRIAEDSRAGLVVVGSRGLGGLKGLALGSVSDALTHKAGPSVLVVKPRAA